MTKLTRSSAAMVGLIAVGAVISISAATVGAKPAGRADSGVVYFAVTHTANGKQYAAGNSTDKLFGTGADHVRDHGGADAQGCGQDHG
jgi:hypothetical protein